MCSHKLISEKELTYNFKKATNLEKLYFLPKIQKRLSAVPGRTATFNCGTPREKISERLDYIFKAVMQDGWSYNKDSDGFLKKIENIGKIPEGAILVTADVIGIYPSISHETGLEALRKRLSQRDSPKLPSEEIVRMTDFVLKNNFFEFNGEVK